MILALCLAFILARQIVIQPKETLTIYDNIKSDEMYKFIYNSKLPVEVSMFDTLGRLIIKTKNKNSSLYSKMAHDGRVKVVIANKSNEINNFLYKCPDPNKEIVGYLGYIKDVDLIGELTRHLNQLIKDQNQHIDEAVEQQKLVANARSTSRMLIAIELMLTIAGAYLMHRDFISMFEKTQAL